MHAFEGDLLIGGLTLSHVHGELVREQPDDQSHDWILAGRLVLSPAETEYLELGRQYRLQLSDGRASQVMIAHMEADDQQHVVAEFIPQDAHSIPSH